MSRLAPTDAPPGPYTVEQYFALVSRGVLEPDDRVELLEGVVVSVAPQSPAHAVIVSRIRETLVRAIGHRATVREEKPLIVGPASVPEPDVAVVSGVTADYLHAHPRTALLVVEVADSSLAQDRLTKASIYAAAGIAEYWIVHVRREVIEVRRAPDVAARRYGNCRIVGRDEEMTIAALPDVTVKAAELLPPASA